MTSINSKKSVITDVAKLLTICLVMVVSTYGDYDLSWSTIDGGGGTSSGGQYVVKGTIGQADSAYSAGGDYEVLGGFWPGEPLCTVDFEHFARFAELWLETGTNLPADLYKDENNIVDYYDLDAFVYKWLWYCPYGWPLK